MPLDAHSYLVAQGWSGKGNGIRRGAIARPVTVTQKKTLSGVGKDRDDAFPFWDHVFTTAAKSIKIKISDDDDTETDASASSELARTTTGMLSNRRPTAGTPASSGTSTPDGTPRYSLLVTAKREAAKRGLYSKFFRGPVLGPDTAPEPEHVPTPKSATMTEVLHSEHVGKRKRKAIEAFDSDRRERRRAKKLKKMEKEARRAARAARKLEKEKKKREKQDMAQKLQTKSVQLEEDDDSKKARRSKSKDRASDRKRKRQRDDLQ